jgi:hypothetical protein
MLSVSAPASLYESFPLLFFLWILPPNYTDTAASEIYALGYNFHGLTPLMVIGGLGGDRFPVKDS